MNERQQLQLRQLAELHRAQPANEDQGGAQQANANAREQPAAAQNADQAEDQGGAQQANANHQAGRAGQNVQNIWRDNLNQYPNPTNEQLTLCSFILFNCLVQFVLREQNNIR